MGRVCQPWGVSGRGVSALGGKWEGSGGYGNWEECVCVDVLLIIVAQVSGEDQSC